MTVPMLDLGAQYAPIREELADAIRCVMDSQRFILGPVVEEFENRCAQYCGTQHAIGVSSGTDALLIALMAEEIGPGDEVITSPFTFFSTAGSIARLGATPVFADIDPATFNIDPEQVATKVSEKTKAIIPVHLFGQCADMDALMSIARDRGLVVIEDAAQSIGARYRGQRAGSIGHYGCFSFFPSKNLGAAGDGGLVTTNDHDRAEKVRSLRVHGSKPKYFHKFIGGNFRLDALQAAILAVKINHLEDWHQRRQRNANDYRLRLKHLGETIQLPVASSHEDHVYNQFTVRILNGKREETQTHLLKHGIGHAIYYPMALHLQECFRYLGIQKGALKESERASREVLSIPIYPELTAVQRQEVCTTIERALNN